MGPLFAADRDDHLLRGRLAKGEAHGYASSARVECELLPGALPWPWLSVSAATGVRFHRADGTASQRWYRSEDLPAGTVIAGLPYRMESLAAEFRLGLIAAL